MKFFSFKNIVFALLFLMCMIFVVTKQYNELRKVNFSTVFFDKWAFTGRSATVLKKMAMGYDLVLADYLWLRSIQSFGGRGMTNRDWRPVYYQFDTLTNIDPYMEAAYTFGNMVVGDEGGHQREGMELINKGMRNLPYRYRCPYEGMYVSNWTLKDKTKARWYGRVAIKALNMPDWLPRIVAYLDIEDGEYFVGVRRYIENILQGLDSDQDTIINIGIMRMADAIDKWNQSIFATALKDLEAQTSTTAIRDITDFNKAETIRKGYRIANFQKLLALSDVLAKRLNRQRIDFNALTDYRIPTPADFEWADRVTTKTFPGKTTLSSLQDDVFNLGLETVTTIPKSPYKDNYVWNPTFAPPRNVTNFKCIMTESERLNSLREILSNLKKEVQDFRAREGRNPDSFEELFDSSFTTPEPYGGNWILDSKSGDVRSSSHPDLRDGCS